MPVTANGGAFVPSQSYDRTGAADFNLTLNLPPVVVTTPTFTPNPALHDNKMIVIKAPTGCTITLPPATGSGMRFQFCIGQSVASGTLVCKVGQAADYMRGAAYTVGTAQASFLTANTGAFATETDTITWNLTTSGLATIGDYIECWDITSNVWGVEAEYASSGAAVTPFSVTD
jgi:hypothetical protein